MMHHNSTQFCWIITFFLFLGSAATVLLPQKIFWKQVVRYKREYQTLNLHLCKNKVIEKVQFFSHKTLKLWEGEHYTIKRTLYLIKVFIGAIVVLIDRLITNIYWQVNWGSKTLKTISQTRWTCLRELRSCKIANISINVIGKQFSTMTSKTIYLEKYKRFLVFDKYHIYISIKMA